MAQLRMSRATGLNPIFERENVDDGEDSELRSSFRDSELISRPLQKRQGMTINEVPEEMRNSKDSMMHTLGAVRI